MQVFNHDYKVVTIDRKNVVSIKWSNRRFEYHTVSIIYYGASNAKQELELQGDTVFFVIDKKNSINMNFIDRFVEGGVFVNGTLFKLSTRKIDLLKTQLRKYHANSQP